MGGVVKAVPSGCFSKMTSARLGNCFSKTLNLRLICARVLSILVAIIVKSLPYSRSSRTSAATSLGVQSAAARGAFAIGFWARVWVVCCARAWVCWRASSSMAVARVETGSVPLTWAWESSTVLQKTLPALPEPEEGAGLVERHAHSAAGLVAVLHLINYKRISSRPFQLPAWPHPTHQTHPAIKFIIIMTIRSDATSLRVDFNRQQLVQEVIVQALDAASPSVADISITILGNQRVPESIVRCISGRVWEKLDTLSLAQVGLGNLACKYLSQGSWQALRTLMLYDNRIETPGVAHLAKARMPSLTELWLMGNLVGAGGVREVGRMRCAGLTCLYVDRNRLPLEEAARMYLLELPQLQYCYILENAFAPEPQLRDLALLKYPLIEEYYIQ